MRLNGAQELARTHGICQKAAAGAYLLVQARQTYTTEEAVSQQMPSFTVCAPDAVARCYEMTMRGRIAYLGKASGS